jgi:hypothetical protein
MREEDYGVEWRYSLHLADSQEEVEGADEASRPEPSRPDTWRRAAVGEFDPVVSRLNETT